MKYADYHTHSGFYRGSGEIWTPEAGWEQIQKKGRSQLGICNKVEFNHPAHDFIPILSKKITDLQNPEIFMGVELDLGHPSGQIVLDSNYLRYLDYIIAGPHNQPVETLAWPDLDEEAKCEYFQSYRDILVNSFKKGQISIWAHPFLQEIENTGSRFSAELFPIFQEMITLCDEKGIAIEINENFFRTKQPSRKYMQFWRTIDTYWADKYQLLERLYSYALTESRVFFSLGSDTHKLNAVGDIEESITFLQKIQIPHSRLLVLTKHS